MNTQYLELGQGRLAFDDRGEGPLVICVPSMGDVRQEYRFLAPLLVEAGYRVVTMDVRGHGESSVKWSDYSVAAVGADILALIRHLNAGPALLVGNSMAGGASVWAAAEAPELIAGMALIDPFVRNVGSSWPGRLLYPVLFADLWGPVAWSKYYATLYPTCRPADWQEYIQHLKGNLSEPGRIRTLRSMLLASKQASEDRLPQVKAPALVIMGTRDPDFKQPAQEAQLVATALHAPVQMIEGAGHYPHAEMPEQVAPLLISFFQQVQEPVSHGS
jgi:pimeloyl-ACP methyl ester carboxylesterase